LESSALDSVDGRCAVVSMVMLPILTQRGGIPGFSLLAFVQKCPANGTGKTPLESAQKTSALCANREIIGFDWGEAEECTAILAVMVDDSSTRRRREKAGAASATPVIVR